MFAQLGSWGLRHRPTSHELRVRAELLEAGGPKLWEEYMAELRETHLGVPRPNPRRQRVTERLQDAYLAALDAG